jgi:hypothetical protein
MAAVSNLSILGPAYESWQSHAFLKCMAMKTFSPVEYADLILQLRVILLPQVCE